jgi:hypothetical protein
VLLLAAEDFSSANYFASPNSAGVTLFGPEKELLVMRQLLRFSDHAAALMVNMDGAGREPVPLVRLASE